MTDDERRAFAGDLNNPADRDKLHAWQMENVGAEGTAIVACDPSLTGYRFVQEVDNDRRLRLAPAAFSIATRTRGPHGNDVADLMEEVDAVYRAWIAAGKNPVHEAQRRLRDEWPALAVAIDRLVAVYGAPFN